MVARSVSQLSALDEKTSTGQAVEGNKYSPPDFLVNPFILDNPFVLTERREDKRMNSRALKQTDFDVAVPWRSRPLVTINLASEVAGISATSIYRLAGQGRLTLKRLAGRVLVETAGLIALIDNAEPWTPSDRGKAARARRSELSRSRWRS